MKLVLTALIPLTLTACEGGSMFDPNTIKYDAVSRLEVAGPDLRVYEFTPRTDPYVKCVYVARGLQCWFKHAGSK